MTKLSMQKIAREYGRLSGLAKQGLMGLDARGPGVPGMPFDEGKTIGLTIAGEIDPRYSPYGQELTAQEIAAILGLIDNRSKLRRMTRKDVVLEPSQFSTWNNGRSRNIAAQNYAKHANEIHRTMRAFYAGDLKSPAPDAMYYYSPSGMRAISGGARSAPEWAADLAQVWNIGPHVFGVSRQDLDRLRPVPIPTRRPPSPAELADIDAEEILRRTNARDFDKPGQPAPPPDGVKDWRDWVIQGRGR